MGVRLGDESWIFLDLQQASDYTAAMMLMTVEEQDQAAALVEELKWLQSRCMGGENPDGVVMIAKSLSAFAAGSRPTARSTSLA